MIYQVCEGDKWDADDAVAVKVEGYHAPDDAAEKFCEDFDHEWVDGSKTIWVHDGAALYKFSVEAEAVVNYHVYEGDVDE